MVNLQTPLERIVKAKSVVSKFAHLGVLTLGDLLWYPPRRTYRWGELTRFDSLIPGADVTVFAVVMDSRLGWTRRHDKAMLTVTLQASWKRTLSTREDSVRTCGERGPTD